MKKLLEYPPCATVALALQDVGTLGAGHVQRGADGVPTGWRLFGFGPFRLTQDGQEYGGEFAQEHADAILAQAERKGTPVPLDAHHSLSAIANELGVDETELAATLSGKRLTLAFARLAKRADGLWLQDIEWTDLGRKLIAGGHFRYFSPVLRGLADGRLRITSVALTNNPALQGLDAIAASDGDTDGTDGGGRVLRLADLVTRAVTPKWKGEQMKELLAKLGLILGTDIALSDDGKAPEAVETKLATLATELPGLRLLAGTAGKVRDALALTADAGEPQILAALQGLQAKGQAHDALKTRVDALALEAETNKRQKVIERGMTEGKLTPALVANWAKGQDAAALEAFLQHAPVIVAPGRTVDAGRLPADADSAAWTDGELNIFRIAGLSDKDVEAITQEKKGKKTTA